MNMYRLILETASADTFTLPISVGPIRINCQFQWSEEWQELWDELQRAMTTQSTNDPLSTNSGFIRIYDYIDFYLSIGRDIDAWLDTTEVMPMSIKSMPRWRQLETIEQRVDDCKNLNIYRNMLKEHLRWQVTVISESGQTVAALEPGGWYQHQDDLFEFRFVSPREYIGRDDLQYVAMEFRVQ